VPLIAAVLCAAVCAGLLACCFGLSDELSSQRAAERWRGGNAMSFAQHSVFLPESAGVNVSDINSFRYAMLEELKKASVESSDPMLLFRDAWCSYNTLELTGDRGSGKMNIIAVGGSFFDFHPLKLLDGSYISDSDFMRDRVVLDRESAWRLFGSYEVAGLNVTIGENVFVVAGVVDRESDRASKLAYGSGMTVFLAFDTYSLITEKTGIACYELVMPEPVRGFGAGVIRNKFPVGSGVYVTNTGRFEPDAVVNNLRHFLLRSVQSSAAALPYWENAARIIEDEQALLLAAAIIFAIFPVIFIVILLVMGYSYFQSAAKDGLLPAIAEKTGGMMKKRVKDRAYPGSDAATEAADKGFGQADATGEDSAAQNGADVGEQPECDDIIL